jgi:hypothetical protein
VGADVGVAAGAHAPNSIASASITHTILNTFDLLLIRFLLGSNIRLEPDVHAVKSVEKLLAGTSFLAIL